MGSGADNGSRAKLQVNNGNTSNNASVISLGQYGSANRLDMGIWTNDASFIQSSFPLSLNPGGYNVGIATTTLLSTFQVDDGCSVNLPGIY